MRPKWEARMGTRQTEIDAAIALRPDDLIRIAREAIAPFFDETLADRTEEAADDWLAGWRPGDHRRRPERGPRASSWPPRRASSARPGSSSGRSGRPWRPAPR